MRMDSESKRRREVRRSSEKDLFTSDTLDDGYMLEPVDEIRGNVSHDLKKQGMYPCLYVFDIAPDRCLLLIFINPGM